MREFTHDQLHEKMESNLELKQKSDEVHSLPKATSFYEEEILKLQMMVIYAEAIGCRQCDSAQRHTKEVYAHPKDHVIWRTKFSIDDWKIINGISEDYTNRKLCHSREGNDFVCFCDE